jgi:hypothetical protein
VIWIRVARFVLLAAMAVALPVAAEPRPGVEPQDAWTWPATHPIKGNFTTYSGERCIYHVPGTASHEPRQTRYYYRADRSVETPGYPLAGFRMNARPARPEINLIAKLLREPSEPFSFL